MREVYSVNTSGLSRTPEKLLETLKILKKYEGEDYTNTLKLKIMKECIKCKKYVPKGLDKSDLYINSISDFTDEDVDIILKIYKTTRSWEDRAYTLFMTLHKIGFVKLQSEKPIEFTMLGNKWISSLSIENLEQQKKVQQSILRLSLVREVFEIDKNKFQTNNKVFIYKRPLVFLLGCLEKLTSLTIMEYIICLGWPSNNIQDCCDFIRKERDLEKSKHIQQNEEKLENILRNTCGIYKIKKLESYKSTLYGCYFNWCEVTGLITKENNSIRLTKGNESLIRYIIDTYNNCSDCYNFFNENDYFKNRCTEDLKLCDIQGTIHTYETVLERYSLLYSYEIICKELNIILTGKPSNLPEFKTVKNADLLELFMSILLYKNMEQAGVLTHSALRPNYTVNNEGMFQSHASGGKADAIIETPNCDVLLEFTLLSDNSQMTKEFGPIISHLQSYRRTNPYKPVIVLFIAPKIQKTMQDHCDRQFSFVTFKKGLGDIRIDNVVDITKLGTNMDLNDYILCYTISDILTLFETKKAIDFQKLLYEYVLQKIINEV